MTLILPNEHRAPFIAPGRRDRKVHWNRPLTKAMEQLGDFEREDFRRGVWLPKSLRMFYPKWNNRFSPGRGCDDCGCEGEMEVPTCGICTTDRPSQVQVTLSGVVNEQCVFCEDVFNGSHILDLLSEDDESCVWRYVWTADGAFCGSSSFPFSATLTFTAQTGSSVVRLDTFNTYLLPPGFTFPEGPELTYQWSDPISDDCANWLEEPLTELDLPSHGHPTTCTGTPTCHITAL